MDTTTAQPNPQMLKIQKVLASVWYSLRSPKTTAVLFLALGVVFLLWLLIPQQPTPDTPVDAWIAALSPTVQPLGEALYFLQFSRILQSVWFWLPVALLLLNSLVALADYTRPSWLRATRHPANIINWQHPLATRIERSTRLPASPDEYLNTLKDSLIEKKISITTPATDNDDRTVSANRRCWSWLAVVAFYVGVIVLIAAFVLGYYSFRTETRTLWPFKAQQSQLFRGALELHQVDAAAGRATVIIDPADAEQPSWAIFLRPYQPTFFNGLVILPTAIEPVITIEAHDSAGEQRRLMPVQADLSPDTRLTLPPTQDGEPIYFLIPSADLAFQITPLTEEDEPGYNVQVRRGAETSPSENFMVQMGDTFDVDDLSVSLTQNHNIRFVARRDWGLPLYLLSAIVILVSIAVMIFLPPWQLWLVPDVKGRGGQLYGVVEKFGSAKDADQFLEALFTTEMPVDNRVTEKQEKN